MKQAFVIVLCLIATSAFACDVRHTSTRDQFKKLTGFPHGRPGYVIDHIVPLACGGKDNVTNMQWQTITEGKAKDKIELKQCTIICHHAKGDKES